MIGRDITGERFDFLVAVRELEERSKDGKVLYLCQCDCGNTRVVKATDLRTGKVHSCGCVHWNKKYKRFSFENPSDMRLYRIWYDMIRRCEDPRRDDYKRYGMKGISVCDEWHDFQSFFDWARRFGYDDTLTLDRIDNKGDYSPTNCRWAGDLVQANNKSNNHLITFNGETHSMAEWARITGINYTTIRNRQRCGWSDYDTLSRPVKESGVVL